MTLRKIDFDTEKYFECGGKTFYITDSLGFTRYKELQKISLEFGYSASMADVFNNLTKAQEFYNEHDYFSMSIVLYKIQEGIKNLEDKDDPALRLCTLFINEADEDTTTYNAALMKAKIDCWAKELEVSPFLSLAVSLVPGWMPAYEVSIRDGLEKEEKTD